MCDLQEGEQCYLLFDPSEKEQLPSVMLDQAKVTAALDDGDTAGTYEVTSAPAEDALDSSNQCREVEQLRTTVNAQQAEIERLRAELVRSTSLLLWK